MIITLDLTEFETETVLKALRNEFERDRAYRQTGVSDTLRLAIQQIETQAADPVTKKARPDHLAKIPR